MVLLFAGRQCEPGLGEKPNRFLFARSIVVERDRRGLYFKGDPVDIVVDTYSKKAVKGHVDSIAPASGQEFALLPPDNATGNFTKIVQRIPVKIAIDPGDPLRGDLRPGMSVTATVDTKAAAPNTGALQPSHLTE